MKDKIVINKKAMRWIAPSVAVGAVLLSKGNPAIVIFIMGIVIGMLIQRDR
jgi:hypothetical protein